MLKHHIQTVDLTSGQGSIVFSGIPQDFTDLYVSVSARCTGTGNTLNVTFNENTSGYSNQTLQGNGGSGSSFANFTRYAALIGMANETSNTFGSSNIYIPNYTGSSNKSYSTDGASENNATQAYQAIIAGLWNNSSPITSIAFIPLDGTFVAGSSISLYGIKRGSDGRTEVASGGVITTSGGYTIHTFNTSGTFVANRNLDVEYLVVAGGGGSSSIFAQAGGGAGGYRCSVIGESSGGGAAAEPKLFLSPQSYSVLVGAGGAGGSNASSYSPGSSGASSTFINVTSVGGGGTGIFNTNGLSGGSGGGAWPGTTPGSGTTGQGFAGSVGATDNITYTNGGAGGGASSAASPATSAIGSRGGDGISSSITGSAVPRAGGGNGGRQAGSAPSTPLGGTAAVSGNGASGAPNTGAGAGGGNGSSAIGGNGGSGVVIIRYLTP
jgi:hypothetical protein